MKKRHKILAMLISVLTVLALFTTTAMAAAAIDIDRDNYITISYMDEYTAIPGATFDIYRVADVNAYGKMTVTDKFKGYPIVLENLDQEEWMELAATLEGFVLRDDIPEDYSGITDREGQMDLNVKAGLFLVLGSKVSIGRTTYTPTAFMLFAPQKNESQGSWNYRFTVNPKFTSKYNPPGKPDTVSRTAVKVWKDTGYENLRPEGIQVQLLRDGEIYDTKVLNEGNNWRYTWTNLSDSYSWIVVEKENPNYTTKVTVNGTVYTITNEYVVPVTPPDTTPVPDVPATTELLVTKAVTGDEPSAAGNFAFVLTSQSSANPMPEGSNGMVKEISAKGPGNFSFGTITFSEPGTYIYKITEKDTGDKSYTYDRNVYTVVYTVTKEDGVIKISRSITGSDGKYVNYPVFENQYTKSIKKLPQTGMPWWPVPLLLVAGFALCGVGLVRRHN